MANDPRVQFYEGERLPATGGYTAVNPEQQGPAAEQTNAAQGESSVEAAGPPAIMATQLFDKDGAIAENAYTVVTLQGHGSDPQGFVGENRLLKDNEDEPAWYDVWENAKQPTTSQIIKWAEEKDTHRTHPYKYSDFVFCKYWKKIPNNHMITLRRFAYPVWDSLKFPGSDADREINSPIAQAVTYMGEDTNNSMSDFLNFDVGLNWGKAEADAHQITEGQGGHDRSPFGTRGVAKIAGILTGEVDMERLKRPDGQIMDPYKTGPYANMILGPVNRITEVKKRDPGLSFNQSFEIDFHYVARPIDGVNTKAAMLDIIANLLILTYAEASFWGGEHRFFANRSGYPFLGGPAGLKKFRQGDAGGFMKEVTNQLTRASESLGALLGGFMDDPIGALKNVAGMGAELGMAQLIRQSGMAMIEGLPALLSGSPVGEWHLVIGNPMNPIMMIGNLICKDIKFKFGNELGPDDFPTELTATISLEHGMARDRAAIESMLNRGHGKIYSFPDKLQNLMDNTGVGTQAKETGVDRMTEGSGAQSVEGGSSFSGNETTENIIEGGKGSWDIISKSEGFAKLVGAGRGQKA